MKHKKDGLTSLTTMPKARANALAELPILWETLGTSLAPVLAAAALLPLRLNEVESTYMKPDPVVVCGAAKLLPDGRDCVLARIAHCMA